MTRRSGLFLVGAGIGYGNSINSSVNVEIFVFCRCIFLHDVYGGKQIIYRTVKGGMDQIRKKRDIK